MMHRVLLLATLLLFGPAHAHACQCGRWPTVPEALDAATVVFEGAVVAKSPVIASYQDYWFVVERWTFAVDRSWKGSGPKVVVTEGYSNCSNIYSLGQKAVVYAYPHESRPNELETHKCGEPLGDSPKQLAALGAPRHVFTSPTSPRESIVRRTLRHFEVYALGALSVAHNALVATRETPGSFTGFVVIAVVLLVSFELLALVTLRRRRVKIASLLAVTVLILAAWTFFIASREVSGPYFSHLVEYQCPTCPGG